MSGAEAPTTPAGRDARGSRSLLSSASAVMLSLLFAMTGGGTALLGAARPSLLTHWQLSDREGGLLFFLAWLGAALGALLSRGDLSRSVVRGVALIAVCCFALIDAGRVTVFPLIFFYGLGLGITMTSISRLRSQRAHARRTQELNRLNLLWACGALLCPLLAARALFTSSATYLFASLGAAVLVPGLWLLVFEGRLVEAHQAARQGPRLPPVPAALCGVAWLAVGVEASLGGWLTTYAKRADHSIAGAVTATSAFWAGLLLSRALHSTPWFANVDAVAALRLWGTLVAMALCLLLAAHGPGALIALAFVLGGGLGPLYPLLLALVLPGFRGNRVFFFAGLGSAVLPWLTGAVSSRAGSLRAGLAVPCVAGCLLPVLVWWVFSQRPGAGGGRLARRFGSS